MASHITIFHSEVVGIKSCTTCVLKAFLVLNLKLTGKFSGKFFSIGLNLKLTRFSKRYTNIFIAKHFPEKFRAPKTLIYASRSDFKGVLSKSCDVILATLYSYMMSQTSHSAFIRQYLVETTSSIKHTYIVVYCCPSNLPYFTLLCSPTFSLDLLQTTRSFHSIRREKLYGF